MLIGLGTQEGDLTLSAKAALDCADKIIARTKECAGFAALSAYEVETLDGVYERSRNFDTLNKNLAKAVMDAAKGQSVCYCVDGAVSEDTACKIILKKQKIIIFNNFLLSSVVNTSTNTPISLISSNASSALN